MLARLIFGFSFVAVMWTIAGAAAATNSAFVVCVAAIFMTLFTAWLQTKLHRRYEISTESVTVFTVLGLIGSMFVIREVSEERLSWWFFGALMATYLFLFTYSFFGSDSRNERTR